VRNQDFLWLARVSDGGVSTARHSDFDQLTLHVVSTRSGPYGPDGSLNIQYHFVVAFLHHSTSTSYAPHRRLPRWTAGCELSQAERPDTPVLPRRWTICSKRWVAFTRFFSDGRICLSNNAVERVLRVTVSHGCSPAPISVTNRPSNVFTHDHLPMPSAA
jgi:Transposase IS66 family